MSNQLLRTPLFDWHVQNGAKMAPFAGWDMPVQYSGILDEHIHTRTKTTIFDISHMGEFLIKGKNSALFLNNLVTHDIENLPIGRCKYGFMLDDEGGIIDDLIIYHLEEHLFMMVVNAARIDIDMNWVKKHMPEDINFENISDCTAKIDIQGPTSAKIVQELIYDKVMEMKYFQSNKINILGKEALLSRTGYTGEQGFELYLPASLVLEIWEKLINHQDVIAGGLGARDTLRLEAGLPLYGQDFDEKSTPIEADYSSMITKTTDFIGKSGLNNSRKILIPLELEGRRSARHGDIIMFNNKAIGEITSGSYAPSLGYSIALGYIKTNYSQQENFEIQGTKVILKAKKTNLPFYKMGTARNKLL